MVGVGGPALEVPGLMTDPAGRDLHALRPMREKIKQRVQGLLNSLS